MVLAESKLRHLLNNGFIVKPYTPELVNPASVDIRIGADVKMETDGGWKDYDLREMTSLLVPPGGFLLASTLERIVVPKDLAIECKLKSSRARLGWNHSLAFWFDPGWDGVGTLEIQNINRYHTLALTYAERFVQLIVHQITGQTAGYHGRYQGASTVEEAKV